MPTEDQGKPTLANFVAESTPELVGSGVGGALQLAGADPLTGGLAGTAIALAMRLDRANWQHAVGRASYTTHLAAQAVGGEEALERLATADDSRRELTARVLRAAARTPLAEKLPALAKVLAAGLDGTTTVDEALVLASALDELEVAHVQVLAVIEQEQQDRESEEQEWGWTSAEVLKMLPAHELVMPALLSTLDRHGLVSQEVRGRTYGAAGRRMVTRLGQRRLVMLRDAGGEAPQQGVSGSPP